MAHRDVSASITPKPLSTHAVQLSVALQHCRPFAVQLQELARVLQEGPSCELLTTREELLHITEHARDASSQATHENADRLRALLSDLTVALRRRYPSQGPGPLLTSIRAVEIIQDEAV